MTTSVTPAGPPSEDEDPRLAGVVDVLRRSVRTLGETPEVIVLLLFVAFVETALPVVGSFVVLISQCLAVFLLAETLDAGRRTVTNSLGVRLILAAIAALIYGIVVLIGLVLLVVPGLYLVVRLYLVIPAVMVDDLGPVEAFGESWTRTEDDTLTIGGVALTALLITYVAGAVVLLASAGGVDAAFERIAAGDAVLASAVMTVVGGLLVAATSAVIYRWTDD